MDTGEIIKKKGYLEADLFICSILSLPSSELPVKWKQVQIELSVEQTIFPVKPGCRYKTLLSLITFKLDLFNLAKHVLSLFAVQN